MAWLTTLPTAIYIGSDRYYERREIEVVLGEDYPADQGKIATLNQVRDRSSVTLEYRGLDYDTAIQAIQGYPRNDSNGEYYRSVRAIGGGGYTVTETQDVVRGNWETLNYSIVQ